MDRICTLKKKKKKAEEMQFLIDGMLRYTLGYPCDETLPLSFAILCRDLGVHQTKEAFKRGMVSVYAARVGSSCVLTTCCDFCLVSQC